MTAKAYRNGSEAPPLEDGKLRLYSNRFCPYAFRTRMVLAHKNIPHEIVNIHLKDKPDWFFAKNPLGLTPTMEHNGLVLYESTICNYYLEDAHPEKSILAGDPETKAHHRLIIFHGEKLTGNIIRMIKEVKNMSEEEKAKIVKQIPVDMKILEEYLGEKPFFAGETPALVDYHMWPFFEMYHCLKELANLEYLITEKDHPVMYKWIERMAETDIVKATGVSKENYVNFAKSFYTGSVDYDVGL